MLAEISGGHTQHPVLTVRIKGLLTGQPQYSLVSCTSTEEHLAITLGSLLGVGRVGHIWKERPPPTPLWCKRSGGRILRGSWQRMTSQRAFGRQRPSSGRPISAPIGLPHTLGPGRLRADFSRMQTRALKCHREPLPGRSQTPVGNRDSGSQQRGEQPPSGSARTDWRSASEGL